MHTNGSPLSLARSMNSNDHSPRNTTGLPSRSPAGFLLLDSSLRPVSFNAEAIHVLSYPDTLANIRRPDVFLAGKIHSSLMTQPSSRESPFVTEFRSGRRRYLCRVLFVDWSANGHAGVRMTIGAPIHEQDAAEGAAPARPELSHKGRFTRGRLAHQARVNLPGEEDIRALYVRELVRIAKNVNRLSIERNEVQGRVQQEESNRRPR